jgi:hypothetical protein
MKLRDYFDSIDISEIERFVTEKQEENVSIEFKTVNHPKYSEKNREFDNKNYSTALSGFANSNGGIIIWGIKASKNVAGQDVAKEKKPIQELTKFLNNLNRLEGQAVTPPITGIIHEKILEGEDLGYIKTFVPQSDIAPHMANFAERHYFKRSGDSFYQCEHYDIVDMFSRKKSPKLKVRTRITGKENRINEMIRYNFLVSIENSGYNIAKYPYLALNVTPGVLADEFGLDGNRNPGLWKVKNNVLYLHNYSGGLEKVIYPTAIFDVDKFYFEMHKSAPPIDVTIDYLLTAEDAESIVGQIKIERKEFL